MAGLTYTALSNCCNLGYIYTKPDKFENATLLYLDRPSVHTKTTFSVSKNGTFWKRSPKWINLKMPAKCVSVDSESRTFWKRWRHNSHVTLSQSLLNHRSKMAGELLTVWKRLMWTENILSVFAAKVAFSNLSGLVWTVFNSQLLHFLLAHVFLINHQPWFGDE